MTTMSMVLPETVDLFGPNENSANHDTILLLLNIVEDHHRDHHEASGGEAIEQQHSKELSKDNDESNSHPSATGTPPESSTVRPLL